MAELTFMQMAQKMLEEEKRPLSPSEIWSLAQAKGWDKNVRSRGKTPSNTIGAQLYVDVRDNPDSQFLKIGVRPRRFGLKSLVEKYQRQGIPAEVALPRKKKRDYLEKDLHPFLAFYAFNYLKAYSKTIHHSKSDRAKFAQWVHLDMVGCYFPFSDWEKEVVELSSTMSKITVKLYSFELKRELNFSNLREAFFQAVSNSSWANEGYLVAAEVADDEDFLDELKRLSASFGIGIIEINREDPYSSEVRFPAKSRDGIDWETVNQLAALNRDFGEFITRIKNDISSREIRKEMYDPVLSKDDLLKPAGKTG